MPRPPSPRKSPPNRRQCRTILAEEDIPCPKQIAQSVPRCRQHQQEYSDLTRKYKTYAAQAETLGASVSMFPISVKKLQSSEDVEDKLRIMDEFITALSEEIDRRIRHQYRFFQDGSDEGHTTRIKIQQGKLNKAHDLRNRLNEHLDNLKTSRRRIPLSSCNHCPSEKERASQLNSKFPALPTTAGFVSAGRQRVPLSVWRANTSNPSIGRPIQQARAQNISKASYRSYNDPQDEDGLTRRLKLYAVQVLLIFGMFFFLYRAMLYILDILAEWITILVFLLIVLSCLSALGRR